MYTITLVTCFDKRTYLCLDIGCMGSRSTPWHTSCSSRLPPSLAQQVHDHVHRNSHTNNTDRKTTTILLHPLYYCTHYIIAPTILWHPLYYDTHYIIIRSLTCIFGLAYISIWLVTMSGVMLLHICWLRSLEVISALLNWLFLVVPKVWLHY